MLVMKGIYILSGWGFFPFLPPLNNLSYGLPEKTSVIRIGKKKSKRLTSEQLFYAYTVILSRAKSLAGVSFFHSYPDGTNSATAAGAQVPLLLGANIKQDEQLASNDDQSFIIQQLQVCSPATVVAVRMTSRTNEDED